MKPKLLNREAMQKLLLANTDEFIPLETYKARINHIFVYVYLTFFQWLGGLGEKNQSEK